MFMCLFWRYAFCSYDQGITKSMVCDFVKVKQIIEQLFIVNVLAGKIQMTDKKSFNHHIMCTGFNIFYFINKKDLK